METAALYGHLDCLKYLHANGVCLHANACSAALHGALIKEEKLNEFPCLPSPEGCIACFQYLVVNGCPLSMDTYSKVARGQLASCWDCLVAAGAPMNDQAVRDAIQSRDLDALTFAHQRASLVPDGACVQALKRSSLPILRYLHEQVGLPLPAFSCELAAAHSADECLQYAHEQGCNWGVSTFQAAARVGCLLCLKYLHTHSCQWDATVCAAASAGNHLGCLKFLHEQGCPWDAVTCAKAITRNIFFKPDESARKCLEYAHREGCPYDANLCVLAAANGNRGCLVYAHKHMGYPLSMEVAEAALHSNDCLIYTVENGCPVNLTIRKAYKRAAYQRDVRENCFRDDFDDDCDPYYEPLRAELYEGERDSVDFNSGDQEL